MTELRLYGSPGSGSAAIEMALRAVDVPYRLIRASTWEGGAAHAQLLEVNPLGQIPTLLLDDGTVLTESVAILLHLALAHPQAGLLPADARERARAIRALVFIAANIYSAVSVADYPERWTTATTKPARDKVHAGAVARLHRHWEIFADAFADERTLGVAQPGALAYLTVVVSRWSGARRHIEASRPRLHRLLQQLRNVPLIAAVLREHEAG